MTSQGTDTRRRVKLYALNSERQWDDRGTGHVSSNYVDRLKGVSLLVRAESDGTLLLESKIQVDTAYQKQQDTLIVWSEGDNFDLALSFQEKAGCDEIWEKICTVQGKDPSVDITQDIVEESEDERFEDMSDSAPPVELPPCELSRLEDILEITMSCLASPARKDKLATAIETEQYIKKLLNIFHICEDLENMEGLHFLYDIFKSIFLLNKNTLFEIMFADDTIFDVIGCLEYDSCETPPKHHRQYLKSLAKYREVIPIENQDLLAKIHQTYRVQYIQDIILPPPSVFVEDTMLNTLSSFIFFNKVEIVTLVQEDEKFLMEIFRLLTDKNTTNLKRRDVVLFLKEFCNFAQNLQPQAKDEFYKTLTYFGVMSALEIALVMDDIKTKSAAIDILTAIVEYSPSIVRNYSLQQVTKSSSTILINIIIEQMLLDPEPELGGAVQLMGIIRMLLDPENMLTEKAEFLAFFYKCSIHILIEPLVDNTTCEKLKSENYHTVQLLGLVLDLMSFCIEHHALYMKAFILQRDLLKRILVAMKSYHTFLVLCALRLFRKIVALKDEGYNKHIVRLDLFAPIVDAFVRNNGRYNLLESAILELFEYIKIEDIRVLCTYVVENFTKTFEDVEYVQTFKHLKARYDQQQEMVITTKAREKAHKNDSLEGVQSIRNVRMRRDRPIGLDVEEIDQDPPEEYLMISDMEYHADVPISPKPEIESYSMMKMYPIEKNGLSSKNASLQNIHQQQQQQQQQHQQQSSPPPPSSTGSSDINMTVNSPSIAITTHPTVNPAITAIVSLTDIHTLTTASPTIAVSSGTSTNNIDVTVVADLLTSSSSVPQTPINENASIECNKGGSNGSLLESSSVTSENTSNTNVKANQTISITENHLDNNIVGFNDQDDESESIEIKSMVSTNNVQQTVIASTIQSSMNDNILTTANAFTTTTTTITTNSSITTSTVNRTSLKKALVDYDDGDTDEDEEEEEDDESVDVPTTKKARIV